MAVCLYSCVCATEWMLWVMNIINSPVWGVCHHTMVHRTGQHLLKPPPGPPVDGLPSNEYVKTWA